MTLRTTSLAGLICLAGCTPPAASPPATTATPGAAAKPVCLASYSIESTSVPDDRTIVFTMRDRTVWKNTLAQPCIGLALDMRGFTYEATDPGSDTICSNLVLIRTNTDGLVCSLGDFTLIGSPVRH